MACKEGQFDVVEEILNNQFNLNAQDVNGTTHFVLVSNRKSILLLF